MYINFRGLSAKYSIYNQTPYTMFIGFSTSTASNTRQYTLYL